MLQINYVDIFLPSARGNRCANVQGSFKEALGERYQRKTSGKWPSSPTQNAPLVTESG